MNGQIAQTREQSKARGGESRGGKKIRGLVRRGLRLHIHHCRRKNLSRCWPRMTLGLADVTQPTRWEIFVGVFFLNWNEQNMAKRPFQAEPGPWFLLSVGNPKILFSSTAIQIRSTIYSSRLWGTWLYKKNLFCKSFFVNAVYKSLV